MGSSVVPSRPSVTAAQTVGLLVAGVPILAQLLHVFGVFDLTLVQQQALEDTLKWAGLVAGALFISDAGLRAARNHAVATVAAVATSPPPPIFMPPAPTASTSTRPRPMVDVSEPAEPGDPDALPDYATETAPPPDEGDGRPA